MAKLDRLTKGKERKSFFSDEIQNIKSFLLQHYEIRIPAQDPTKIRIISKDENRYVFPPSSDDIWLHMKSEGYSVSESVLRKILRSPNYITPYDPIKEYFDSLRKKYKGESHIALFSKHIIPRCFDEHSKEYYRERTDKLIKKWLVACVACWLDNIPNDVALGFIHCREGIGKTHLVQYLLPAQLSEYFIKSSRDDRRFELEDAFTRYMLINFDELEGLNTRNIDQFKKCMSDSELLNKRKHEEFATLKDRIGCAAFTTNRTQEKGGFLHENYGYRRFGVIELDDIDRNYSSVVNVDQLWAEALNLYEETNFQFRFDLTDFDEFHEYNRRYIEETKAMKYVRLYTSIPRPGDESEKLTATEIYNRLRHKIRNEDLKEFTLYKLGTALSALDYPKASFRKDLNSVKGYNIIINENL